MWASWLWFWIPWFWASLTAYGTKLDFVSFLCLSMSVGLVVDYATHTSHAYLHADGNPDEKLYHAITEMGASVLSGGGSTVLGIGVLGFASSKAFRNFFYILGTAVFLGTALGIVVSPVLLRCMHGVGIFVGASIFPERKEPIVAGASTVVELLDGKATVVETAVTDTVVVEASDKEVLEVPAAEPVVHELKLGVVTEPANGDAISQAEMEAVDV